MIYRSLKRTLILFNFSQRCFFFNIRSYQTSKYILKLFINRQLDEVSSSGRYLIEELFFYYDANYNRRLKDYITKDDLEEKFLDQNITTLFCESIYRAINEENKDYNFFNNDICGKEISKFNLLKKIYYVVLIVTAAVMLGGLVIIGFLGEVVPGFKILLNIVFEAIRIMSVFTNNPGILLKMQEYLIWMPFIVVGWNWLVYLAVRYFLKMASAYSGFTDIGVEHFCKFKGLKRYLENIDIAIDKTKIVKKWKEYYALAIVFDINEQFSLKLKKENSLLNEKDVCLLDTFESILKNLRKEKSMIIEDF